MENCIVPPLCAPLYGGRPGIALDDLGMALEGEDGYHAAPNGFPSEFFDYDYIFYKACGYRKYTYLNTPGTEILGDRQ